MRWFLVKIVFQIKTGASDRNHQFDESFRLLEANDIADAYNKAVQKGLAEQISFPNIYSEMVDWKFIDVPDVIDLGQLKDGIEIFTQTGEEKYPEEYIGAIRARASEMKKVTVNT